GFAQQRVVATIWKSLSSPGGAWLLHGAAIWVWHIPSLYDASVTREGVHVAQHASFMITALLFWWSVLEGSRRASRSGLALVALFTTALHTTLLGALLSTASSPLYSSYDSAGTGFWGLTPLEDQQLGGIIMWVPGGLAYLVAGLFIFLGWMRRSGERAVKAESARRQLRDSAVLPAMLVIVMAIFSGCSTNNAQSAAELTGGNPGHGHDAIRRYGCQSCHTIPGVTGAVALVGPNLDGVANRAYIAGVLTNTPQHMIEWIRNPPALDSKTAMPNLNVTEKDARDMAAYLYTLR
ncbi:MAG TPA: cytochrome c oxidase assembly protein, partial [Gemmatimonadaceae bacterium]|nr:cytochrome c oxidase assembly protein [Gemmatimonadaceae bacterium]